MRKVKVFRCPVCRKDYQSLKTWENHMRKQHPGEIPRGMTAAQYFYYLQTGKDHGSCVMCHKPTRWNEATGKYERFCSDPKCKQDYRKMFEKRMLNTRGTTNMLTDPEHQRKMLLARRTSGEYQFDDGGKVAYCSTYEKDFLEMLDRFLDFNSSDIMAPSPHTYKYTYKNPEDSENEGEKFYIPDFWIPSLNMEIEIKQNTSTHPKIIRIDKVKEAQKDAMMKKMRGTEYLKIVDKDYSQFFDILFKLREEIPENDLADAPAPATESFGVKRKDTVKETVVDLYNKLCHFKYGTYYKGTIVEPGNPDMDALVDPYYKTATPKQFESRTGGMCWDYVSYEYEVLKKLGYAAEAYYVELFALDKPHGVPNCLTHTFLVIPGEGVNYYIEASYGVMMGVYTFKSIEDVMSCILRNQIKELNTTKYNFSCYKYIPDRKFYHCSALEFVDKIADFGKEMPFKYNPSAKITPVEYVETTATESAVESFSYIPEGEVAQEGLLDFFTKTPSSAEDKKSIIADWKSKIFGSGDSLIGGTPTTTKYHTPFKVLVDNKNELISIQNINIPVLIKRIRDTFGEHRLDYIFDRTYDSHDIKKYKRKRMARSQMKVTSLTTPTFFALELTVLFKELYRNYHYSVYASIAKQIYQKTWLSNADNKSPESINLNALKALNPKYELGNWQKEFITLYPKLKSQLNLRGYYLAFDQGLGKTLTASALAETTEAEHVYIVCPNTLAPVWKDELSRYFLDDNHKAWICNKSMPKNPSQYKYFIVNNESIKNIFPFTNLSGKKMIIVDESHNFRNYNGQRVQDLIQLREKLAPSDVLLLSGTPIKAIPSEIVPALLMLDPLFTPHAAEIYNTCFKFDSYLAMDIVKERFGKVIYRKTKEEVLALPNKEIQPLMLSIANPERYFMKNIRELVKKRFDYYYTEMSKNDIASRERLISLIQKYSTATRSKTDSYLDMMVKVTDREKVLTPGSYHELDQEFFDTFITVYVEPNPSASAEIIDELRLLERKFIRLRNSAMGKAVGEVYPPARASLFNSLFDENANTIISMIKDNPKKTVIFSQLLPIVNHIHDRLNENGVATVKVVGGDKNRMEIINQFKEDPNIECIIATSQTMGTGVTLIEANLMFFFGPPWRSTDFDQCCDRIYRIGQTSDVRIFNVQLDTPEFNLSDRMNRILNWSAEMFHSAIDQTSEVANENAVEFIHTITSVLDEHYEIPSEIATESSHSSDSIYPVFLLVTEGHSPISGPIKAVTGSRWSHASISFNSSLNPMYSFGTKTQGGMGFVTTYPKDPTWGKVPVGWALYVTYVTKEQLAHMKDRVKFFVNHQDKLKYWWGGLVRNALNLGGHKDGKWFCSEFCAEILRAGKKADQDVIHYRPADMPTINDTYFVTMGDSIYDYNQKDTVTALRTIKRYGRPAQEGYYGNYFANRHSLKNDPVDLMQDQVDDFIREFEKLNKQLLIDKKKEKLEPNSGYLISKLDIGKRTISIYISRDNDDHSSPALATMDENSAESEIWLFQNFFNKYTLEEKRFIFLHELGHIMLGHTESKNRLKNTDAYRERQIRRGKVVYIEEMADAYAMKNGGNPTSIIREVIESKAHQYAYGELINRYKKLYFDTLHRAPAAYSASLHPSFNNGTVIDKNIVVIKYKNQDPHSYTIVLYDKDGRWIADCFYQDDMKCISSPWEDENHVGALEKLSKAIMKKLGASLVLIPKEDEKYLSRFKKLGFEHVSDKGQAYALSLNPNDSKNVKIEHATEAVITHDSMGMIRKDLTEELVNQYKTNENLLKHCRTKNTVGAMFFDKKTLVCYVAVDTTNDYIVALWVNPDYRRKGYAKKMLTIAMNTYGAKHLSVNKANLGAYKLYESTGWSRTGGRGMIVFMTHESFINE